jgi:uncharacterized protein YqeY
VLKERLRSDLTAAMKARDEVRVATLRMALTAVSNAETAGQAHQDLSDDDVLGVLSRETKKRRESAEAFDGAGRTELAERERAEEKVLAEYLPQPLTDEELTSLVSAAIAETGADSVRQMGQVMKAVQSQVGSRADGRRVSTEVRRQLSGA